MSCPNNKPIQRWCYYVPTGQHSKKHGGYVPSKVVENEEGHYPMTGGGHEWAEAWVWGKTHEEAMKVCNEVNARMNVSNDRMHEIVASTMKVRLNEYKG